jgi:precorrin-6Y C5,15-methyltransferase (decarboxylating)
MTVFTNKPSVTPTAKIPAAKWLTVVGIGEDGIDGLSEQAKAAISGADLVFGGSRHLALAAPLITAQAQPWPTPFDSTLAAVRAVRGEAVCVLASGDPMLHGVGATLSRVFAADEMQVLPMPSAFSLAASRLAWPLAEVTTLSLHGRDVAHVRRYLQPGRKLLVLTSDSQGPAAIAAYLCDHGLGGTTLTVLEALGGSGEKIHRSHAASFQPRDIHPLNLLAVEIAADATADFLPLAPGIADDWFDHDGQITKRDIRALILSALQPLPGQLLWDIGGGAGSIAIEWLLQDPSMRAVSVERHAERAARIARNARRLGVPDLTVMTAAAPAAYANLPPPDAVFIGGGGSNMAVIDGAIKALRAGGRLVVNAVTLETENQLITAHKNHGGRLLRLALAEAQAVGKLTGWRAAMPVTQWSWSKP